MVGVSLRPHAGKRSASEVAAGVLEQLRHRGPDGLGLVDHGTAALGMARLRVRSRPLDSVPFAGSGAVFAFNGEVYRADGVVPEGGLEEARRAGEPDAATAVDGMYAVVGGDPDGTLRAVRDPLGIKPLYLREAPEGVAVASEVGPLVDVFGRAPVRPAAFAQFLLSGRRVVDGGSFFEGIRAVRPGERLTLRDGRITRSVPARPAPCAPGMPEAAELRAALETAVDRMLLTDRRVGLAVSGGLDSTLVARLLARRGIRDLPTVSVLPQDTGDGVRDLSDLGLSDAVIDTWQHHSTSFGPADLLAGLPAAVRSLGEPVAMSSLPMYRALAKLAGAAGITVLLVGEGADELFAGYHRYRALYAGEFTDPVDFYLPYERLELVTALLGGDACADATGELRRAVGRSREAAAERLGIEPTVIDVVREHEYEHSLEPLLRRTDHLLMAEGIEGRTPFLHGGVAELARRYPARSLVRGSQTKAALREAFADLLPPSYRVQPKQPFRAPVRQWLRGGLLPRVDRTLADATESLRRLGVRPAGMLLLRERLAAGDAAACTLAFALLSTVEWLHWLDDSAARSEVPVSA
ncbi:asparagine synthetase B family protein [Streptomyces sp. Je 1-369]|uniref:asparagine synthetase B family protein n=1 Tax=Streptomyces sp. Je 1-369 TaxID=2966192 RepID=UPI00228547FC|nr:asparagine synthetase B [Streptomyces sp. Je 1-369]WAL96414.1 asparagine synthetase B [Streptomyces sp. Je 1-369]